MKIKNYAIIGIATASFAFSACGTASNTATTNSTNTNKPAANTNATTNTNANSTTNTAANTNANTNSTAKVDGDVINIDEAGITMVVPKGFKHSKDGGDIIVQTEDNGVDIRFSVPNDGDYSKAITDAATEIDDYLQDVKVEDKGSKTNIASMEATSMSGTATNEGEPVMWNLTIINAPKKPVLANIYAEKTSLDKHAADVKKFLESVKKQ